MSQQGDSDRRHYWARFMDTAYQNAMDINDVPIEECGQGLVSLVDAAGDAGVEVAFSRKTHANGQPRLFYLREGIVNDFIAIARDMNDRGWCLKIEDGYRSREMQRWLGIRPSILEAIIKRCQWETGQVELDADFVFRRVAVMVALWPKFGTHMSGSAIDVSVFHRDDGTEVDRGGVYLDFSEITPMESPFISDSARKNRQEITEIFAGHGFVAYPAEFWHYSKGDVFDRFFSGNTEPAQYGPVDWSVTDNTIQPIPDPTIPLTSMKDHERMIKECIERTATS